MADLVSQEYLEEILTIRKDSSPAMAEMTMRAASEFITAPPVIGVSEEGDP